MLLVFLSLLVSVGYLAANPELTSEPFSELYVLGANGNTTEYPQTLAPGETANVTVGVSNHEHQEVRYRLAVEWNGSVTQERRLTLKAGETTEQTIPLTAPSQPGRYRVQFILYSQNIDDEPLTARLWVRVQ